MSRILHTFSDGGARGNPGPSAIGVVLCDPAGHVVEETAECIGTMTNNRAEYRAMIKALELAQARQAEILVCHADSQLMIFQLKGTYRIKDVDLKALAEKVQSAATRFKAVTWTHVPREHPMIARADQLLNKALDQQDRLPPAETKPTQGELF